MADHADDQVAWREAAPQRRAQHPGEGLVPEHQARPARLGFAVDALHGCSVTERI